MPQPKTTLRDLLQGKPALRQCDIMAKADKLLPAGRYYGGPLTDDQIQQLDPPQPERTR